jgi:pimeloyl-ACP methyl ester carboxylesterase
MPPQIPLILLPGLLCDAALWRNQINHLKDIADCQVADITRHERMDALARDVLSNAPPQFALAGLSMGGYVAFEIMRQAPERVIKLCLLNTAARPDTADQRERRQLLLMMSHKGQFKGVTPRLLPTLIHPDRLNDQDLLDTILTMAERVGRDAFYNQQTAIMNRIDSCPYLKNIRCPVQIIGGLQDFVPQEAIKEITTGIPQAKMVMLDRCVHLSPLEQPDQVNRIMERWLRS